MVRRFFRRKTTIPAAAKVEDDSTSGQDDLSCYYSDSDPQGRDNEDWNPPHDSSEQQQQQQEQQKPTDFAAAGRRMKWALRNVLNDVDKLQVVENENKSRNSFAEMKKKILDSMESCKQQDDNDNNDDDDKEKDKAASSNANWMLSPQQVFDLTLSTLRAQIETMEERNNFIARIRALEQQLDDQRKGGDCLLLVQEHAHDASKVDRHPSTAIMTTQLLTEQIKTVQQELQESRDTIGKLQQERDAQKKAVTDLSRVLRASDLGTEDAFRLSQHVERPGQAENEITPERALYLTIYGLKKKIEVLEDERDGFTSDIHNLAASLNELQEEKEARELKIAVLENQFEVMEKQFKVMDDAMKEGPLSRHMVPAGNFNY